MSSDAARGAHLREPPHHGSGPYEHVLVLGLDGLSRAFLEAPLVQDTMPNLLGLLRGSATGTLRSTHPPYTAPGWTSITTGMDPDRHGVFSFTDAAGRPVTANHVAVPRVWDYVGEAGGRSIVVNVPLTHPPRSIDGTLISGMPVPRETPFTWPEPLARTLSDEGYVVDTAVREGSREPAGVLTRLRQMTEARGRVAARLARSQAWDLFMVVFVLPDRLGHPWWKQLVPGDAHYETGRGKRLRRAAARPLRALDRAIGDLLASTPPSTAVVVCSDHGFGPLHGEVFFDVALARAGLIPAPASGVLRRSALALGRSRVSALAPSALRRWGKAHLSSAQADGSRRAWTAPGYECGVRLADPDDDRVREQVMRLLRGLRDPSGNLVFRTVRRREELFTGPLADGAPELVCETSSEAVDLHDGLHARDPWVSRDAFAWGTHAVDGIVAISGAAAEESVAGRAPDVTPTVLHLLGLEAPGLDGTPLAVLPGVVARTVSSSGSDGSTGTYSERQEGEVLDHLRALGYVE